jgi:hypothetical protein
MHAHGVSSVVILVISETNMVTQRKIVRSTPSEAAWATGLRLAVKPIDKRAA